MEEQEVATIRVAPKLEHLLGDILNEEKLREAARSIGIDYDNFLVNAFTQKRAAKCLSILKRLKPASKRDSSSVDKVLFYICLMSSINTHKY